MRLCCAVRCVLRNYLAVRPLVCGHRGVDGWMYAVAVGGVPVVACRAVRARCIATERRVYAFAMCFCGKYVQIVILLHAYVCVSVLDIGVLCAIVPVVGVLVKGVTRNDKPSSYRRRSLLLPHHTSNFRCASIISDDDLLDEMFAVEDTKSLVRRAELSSR
ncbi:hypothetical protein Tcan_14668 [Toxocara canis]|uniref:Uncharacterized protein n=2 Tax=Toxocara canis TaxID=6265 RepID=A0A0B2V5L4_TOXCA|nr:hypothetical protein Tcan_14668 [Toxocara canis]VDM40953.1 unnamed protein product [Toxocara canis]